MWGEPWIGMGGMQGEWGEPWFGCGGKDHGWDMEGMGRDIFRV